MTTLRLATRDDDALLRRLMRDNGMPSWVEMAVEREPSYFAAHDWHGQDWAVIAEDGADVVGMYSAGISPLHVNGRQETVGYLGGLRVESSQRHRIRHLRQGYASIRRLAPATRALPWWFTVVADGNTAARRLLEAGVRGLPRYRPLGALTTFAVAADRRKTTDLWRRAGDADIAALLNFHQVQAAGVQLAPVLSRSLVERIGVANFWLHEDGGQLVGVAALWDQSGFKQVVARRYHRTVQAGRPLYNAFAKVTRRVALPPVGCQLPQSFVAFAAFAASALAQRQAALDLIRGLLAHCPTPVAAIGLHEDHPLVPALERLAPLRYRTRIYAVEFDQPAELDGRPVQPEVALL